MTPARAITFGVLLAAGLAGLVGCFLPLAGQTNVAFWALRHEDWLDVAMTLVGFGAGAVLGALGFVRSAPVPWRGQLALLVFTFAGVKSIRMLWPVLGELQIGGLLMVGGGAVGTIVALVYALKNRSGG